MRGYVMGIGNERELTMSMTIVARPGMPSSAAIYFFLSQMAYVRRPQTAERAISVKLNPAETSELTYYTDMPKDTENTTDGVPYIALHRYAPFQLSDVQGPRQGSLTFIIFCSAIDR
jgi:hypothetical protein